MEAEKDCKDDFSNASIEHGRRLVIDWKDFETAATALPEFEEKSRTVIANVLGYLPPFPTIYMPYEPFIRSLISAYEKDSIDAIQFMGELEFCVKKIRNDDMKKHGFAESRYFTSSDYVYYKSHLSQFKWGAQQRLSWLLGHDPELKYSLGAEMQLRQLFLAEDFYEAIPPGPVDHRCFTIYHYRKHLVDNGIEAADTSPIITFYS